MGSRPWSNKQLKLLSDEIRAGHEPEEYQEVMLWFNDIAAEVQAQIEGYDWKPILGGITVNVSSRPKTIDTLRQKLIRQDTFTIVTIQDVAGVRLEADMSINQQTMVAESIAGMFDHDPKDCISDLRDEPHSGYRAMHVRLKLEGRVEVQVRTKLQGQWANTYERAADVMGREIRYDALPKDSSSAMIVERLRSLSEDGVALLEKTRQSIEDGMTTIEGTLSRLEQIGDSHVFAPERERAERHMREFQEVKDQHDARAEKLHSQLADIETMFDDIQRERLEA